MGHVRTGLSLCLMAAFLPGCVVGVAGSAAGAAISVAGGLVSTGVKVTGTVIEKTVDAVTPSTNAAPN